MKLLALLSLALFFVGCAAPQHYRKELSIEVKEKNLSDGVEPSIIATFRIYN